MSGQAPTKVTVFAYQVGFGDCLLVRFCYPDVNRHVLIDFGSFPKPRWAAPDHLLRTAQAIHDECGGKLDAVVVTHRHADHINGFSTEGDAPGSIIAACQPDLVVQPWTEDPEAQENATGPTAAFLGAPEGSGNDALRRGRAFVGNLGAMGRFAEAFNRERAAFAEDDPAGAEQLCFLGENNLSNASAVKNLMAMGAAKRAKYVYFGSDSGLGDVLPGVDVQVLGPPTLEQSDRIKTQAA